MSEPNYIHAIRFVKKSDRVRQFLIPLRQLIDPQVLVMGGKINLDKNRKSWFILTHSQPLSRPLGKARFQLLMSIPCVTESGMAGK
jgi:hypothetical protein